MAQSVLYREEGKIAYITINRPEVLNAINREANAKIMDILIKLRDNDKILVAIITGAGEKAFSTGEDMKESAERTLKGFKNPVLAPGYDLIHLIQLWKPLIAAINGYCLGGGLELALSCDIRVAAEHATLGLPEVKRATIPSGSGTQRLPRIVPFGIALELLLTGDTITAQEALRIGLVNHVVPMPDLMPAAKAIANKISENGPLAVMAAKEAAYKGIDIPFDTGLRLESLFCRAIEGTEDNKEGPRAFVEKRRPRYTGK